MVIVNGEGTGGTTTLSAGNAIRSDEPLREIGIRLDSEFEELAGEVPASTAHQRTWSAPTRRLFEASERLGLEPRPTPKMIDDQRCRRCGRCVLGCPNRAKWDSRRFLEQAMGRGAELITGCRVRRVVIRDGRAVGVVARVGRGESSSRPTWWSSARAGWAPLPCWNARASPASPGFSSTLSCAWPLPGRTAGSTASFPCLS